MRFQISAFAVSISVIALSVSPVMAADPANYPPAAGYPPQDAVFTDPNAGQLLLRGSQSPRGLFSGGGHPGGYPPQSYPPGGYPPQSYPPGGYPNPYPNPYPGPGGTPIYSSPPGGGVYGGPGGGTPPGGSPGTRGFFARSSFGGPPGGGFPPGGNPPITYSPAPQPPLYAVSPPPTIYGRPQQRRGGYYAGPPGPSYDPYYGPPPTSWPTWLPKFEDFFDPNPPGGKEQWTGLYFGGSIAFAKTDIKRYWPGEDHWAPAGTSISQMNEGWPLGGFIGYNQQLGRFVFSIEAAALQSKFKKSERSPQPSTVGSDPVTISYDVKEMFIYTARAGYALGDWLPYLKGGIADGEFTTFTRDSVVSTGALLHWADTSVRQQGLVLGGGVEYALSPNIMLGLEYLRIKFDAENHYLPTVSGSGIANPVFSSSDVSANIDVFTARVAVKFPPL